VSVERETKLDVGPGFRLPGFDGVRDGVRAIGSDPEQSRTAYWDTKDLRLARWGCSLRNRVGQGWTLKLAPLEHGGAIAREEIVRTGPADRVPEELSALVTAYARGQSLQPVVTLRTVQTRVVLADADRTPLGEVVDDEVSVVDGLRVTARFREVEVETRDEELAAAALARLRAAGAGDTIRTPKYLRALGPDAAAPPELLASASLPPDAAVVDVVRNAVAASVIRLVRADAGIRLGDDPEAVHQARVAARRLRSDLRTFRPLLDRSWAGSLREGLSWLGGSLGAVRDLDVLARRLETQVATLPDQDRPAGERLVGRLRAVRSAARERMLVDLRSPRYVALLDALVAAASQPGVLDEAGSLPAREAMGSLMARPLAHLTRACEAIHRRSPDEVVHAARIRAKRARYAADAVAPVFGKEARSFVRAAGKLQDRLGEHQDAVVAAAWLRETARTYPSTAFVAGLIAAREEKARLRARTSWRPLWKAVRRKEPRSWR
jgi:CHAD domain-containing protein